MSRRLAGRGARNHEPRRHSALALVGVGLVAVSCYAATDVRVTVTTDLPCAEVGRIAVFAGPGTASESAFSDLPTVDGGTPVGCTATPDGSLLGSVVVLPRESSERSSRVVLSAALALRASDSKSPDACFDDPSSCIVVRRTVTFAPHETVETELRFFRRCVGVRCGDTQTCGPEGTCLDAANVP